MAAGARYLLFDTAGPWSDPDARFPRTAAALAESGTETVLCLVGDAVGAALHPGPGLERLLAAGGRVWAERAALERRALAGRPLGEGVEPVGMDEICDAVLAEGTRVLWH